MPKIEVELKTKIMFDSWTSYEFGNPWAPYQSPLSRLEFPMDSIWTGLAVRGELGRVSLGMEFLTTLADQESGLMRDSDWDDDSIPGRLATFSSSACRMRPSYQFSADIDLQIADLVGLPEGVQLRPVAGFRWQQVSFTTHDGVQNTFDPTGVADSFDPLFGDTIDFDQTWRQFFVGVRLGYEWTDLPVLHRLAVHAQGDWSHVQGNNLDHHLLREDRVTRERTWGYAWHGLLGVSLGLSEQLDLDLEAEYLRIETTGSHEMIIRSMDTYINWSHGVRAWSEQRTVSAALEYRF
ncbi:omptin family outer membrane protease [Megalodesulfovibrio paquesii]